ncbi:sodium:proton antiporter, partial [Streptomyces sp. SID10244]|nr:sodium:proton antiporter [Streptomyces sp. SID10244]
MAPRAGPDAGHVSQDGQVHQILLVVVAVLGIAAAQVIGPRIRVAPPLLLVVVGVVVGVMPFVP